MKRIMLIAFMLNVVLAVANIGAYAYSGRLDNLLVGISCLIAVFLLWYQKELY